MAVGGLIGGHLEVSSGCLLKSVVVWMAINRPFLFCKQGFIAGILSGLGNLGLQ